MTAIAFILFAAHVVAWIVLPSRRSSEVVESAPAFGNAVAAA